MSKILDDMSADEAEKLGGLIALLVRSETIDKKLGDWIFYCVFCAPFGFLYTINEHGHALYDVTVHIFMFGLCVCFPMAIFRYVMLRKAHSTMQGMSG